MPCGEKFTPNHQSNIYRRDAKSNTYRPVPESTENLQANFHTAIRGMKDESIKPIMSESSSMFSAFPVSAVHSGLAFGNGLLFHSILASAALPGRNPNS